MASGPVLGHNFTVRLLDASEMLIGAIANLIPGASLHIDAGFSECRGLEGTLQVQDYPEGGRNDSIRHFPTRMSWSNISLQKGVGISKEMWNWYFAYVRGQGHRRNGLIMLRNDSKDLVAVWKFKRGLPVKWTGPQLTAGSSQLAIEALEIAHEGLEAQPGPGLFGRT